jgi:hypothetical protein
MLKDTERGFMLLSAIFLTLIVAIMAQILLHANSKVQQRNSTLYYTAINLANEQFAVIESIAAETGVIDTSCHIPADELKSYNGVSEDSVPIEFKIYTSATGSKVTVKVEWTVKGETEKLESTKFILTKNVN